MQPHSSLTNFKSQFNVTLNYSLLNDPKNYTLTYFEWFKLLGSSAYADRHFKAAAEAPEDLRLRHTIIGWIEKMPIVGGLASLAERILVFALCHVFKVHIAAPKLLSAKELTTKFDTCLVVKDKKYVDLPFSEARFKGLARENNLRFQPIHNPESDDGFIEKKDLPKDSKILVHLDGEF
jgi:hypothetical protein